MHKSNLKIGSSLNFPTISYISLISDISCFNFSVSESICTTIFLEVHSKYSSTFLKFLLKFKSISLSIMVYLLYSNNPST